MRENQALSLAHHLDQRLKAESRPCALLHAPRSAPGWPAAVSAPARTPFPVSASGKSGYTIQRLRRLPLMRPRRPRGGSDQHLWISFFQVQEVLDVDWWCRLSTQNPTKLTVAFRGELLMLTTHQGGRPGGSTAHVREETPDAQRGMPDHQTADEALLRALAWHGVSPGYYRRYNYPLLG